MSYHKKKSSHSSRSSSRFNRSKTSLNSFSMEKPALLNISNVCDYQEEIFEQPVQKQEQPVQEQPVQKQEQKKITKRKNNILNIEENDSDEESPKRNCGCGKGCPCVTGQCKCRKPRECGCQLNIKSTSCNPKGNLCRTLTIGDLYNIWQSNDLSDTTRLTAKEFLSQIKCLPPIIGKKFWPYFKLSPLIGIGRNLIDKCECGKFRNICECISSRFTTEDTSITLAEFKFKTENVRNVDNIMTVFPFGDKVVPSPLKISELAIFTIYACKRASDESSSSEDSSSDDDSNDHYFYDCNDKESTIKLVEWIILQQLQDKIIKKEVCENLIKNLMSINLNDFSSGKQKLITKSINLLQVMFNNENTDIQEKLKKKSKKVQGEDDEKVIEELELQEEKEKEEEEEIPHNPGVVKLNLSTSEVVNDIFHCKGIWKCETVTCKNDCFESQCVKYRIEIDEKTLRHEDGGELCEGWGFFTKYKFTHYIFEMKSQILPFHKQLEENLNCNC